MKKILIFRQSSLGDFIVGIPALAIIRKKFPKHRIYYLLAGNDNVSNPIKDAVNPNTILNNNKLVDEFLYINKENISFIGLIKLIIRLRKYQFAKFYYLNQTEHVKKFSILRNLLFFSLCKIKEVNGFDLLRHKADYNQGNESFYIARRVDKKIKRKDVHKFITSSYKIIKHNQKLTLKKFLLQKCHKKFITISHGQRNQVKDWGFKNWTILLSEINYCFPSLIIIIVGTKQEYKRAEKLKKIKYKNIINLCGKTSIKELIEIINKSKFHISHDDGTMHVASMFNKRSIAIFSTLSPNRRWLPSNKNLNSFHPKNFIEEIKPNLILKKFKKNFF